MYTHIHLRLSKIQPPSSSPPLRISFQTHQQVAIDHRGIRCVAPAVSYKSTSQDLRSSILTCPNIDDLTVTRQNLNFKPFGAGFEWSLTFVSDMEESDMPIQIQILWDGPGAIAETRCFNCSAMSNAWSLNPGETFSASEAEKAGDWEESAILQSEERAGGDRFGAAVALHHEAMVISAPQGGAEEAVTWDFETGDLTGKLNLDSNV